MSKKYLFNKLPYIICNIDKLTNTVFKLQKPSYNHHFYNFKFGSYLGRLHKLTNLSTNIPCYTWNPYLVPINENTLTNFVLTVYYNTFGYHFNDYNNDNININIETTFNQTKCISLGFVSGFMSNPDIHILSQNDYSMFVKNFLQILSDNNITENNSKIIQFCYEMDKLWQDFKSCSVDYNLWCHPIYKLLNDHNLSSYIKWLLIITIFLKNIDKKYPTFNNHIHTIKLPDIHDTNIWKYDLKQWRIYYNIPQDAKYITYINLPNKYRPINNIVMENNTILDSHNWAKIYQEIKRANNQFIFDLTHLFSD